MSQDNFYMSQDIYEMSMHKNHGGFQKLSVTVKHTKSQVQNDKVLLLFNLSLRIFVLIFRLVFVLPPVALSIEYHSPIPLTNTMVTEWVTMVLETMSP